MNQCQLMGRLVRDPELKYTPQGTAVTSFTLAVDRRFNRDKADYINIIAWRQTAEFVGSTSPKASASQSSPILSILRTPKRKAPPEATPKAP